MQLFTSCGVPINNYYRSLVGIYGNGCGVIRAKNRGIRPYELD